MFIDSRSRFVRYLAVFAPWKQKRCRRSTGRYDDNEDIELYGYVEEVGAGGKKDCHSINKVRCIHCQCSCARGRAGGVRRLSFQTAPVYLLMSILVGRGGRVAPPYACAFQYQRDVKISLKVRLVCIGGEAEPTLKADFFSSTVAFLDGRQGFQRSGVAVNGRWCA